MTITSSCTLLDEAPLKYEKSSEIDFNEINAKVKEKYNGCHKIEICDDILEIDCGAEFDGDLIYINNTTGEILMYCGGRCEPEARKIYGKNCSQCPPKEWSCNEDK